jgi:hypothetical protein
MGCDIHLYVEVKDENGVWKSADTWFEEDGQFSTYETGMSFVNHAFYSGRSYDLFSILASVRNGRGFAGVETGAGFVPIAEPKGVPEDMSPEYQRVVGQWYGDGHSHSFLTVQEMMNYDWTQTTTKTGLVGRKEFARFKLEGKPKSWCAGSSAEEISNDEMQKRILRETGKDELDWSVFHLLKESQFAFDVIMTRVFWEVSYYEPVSDFLSETMPKLWKLGSPENVRIVFFFDN